MENNKKEKVVKPRTPSDDEKMLIVSKADEIKGEQLSILPDGNIKIDNELQSLLDDKLFVDDPEKKFGIYYRGIEKLLRKHLQKGPQFAKARSFIREEKNVYLTRGKRLNEKGFRGADSRMTYIEDGQEILKIITNWVIKNGTMVELYTQLRDLNVKMGYGTRVIY